MHILLKSGNNIIEGSIKDNLPYAVYSKIMKNIQNARIITHGKTGRMALMVYGVLTPFTIERIEYVNI